jgi:hypothetical protein
VKEPGLAGSADLDAQTLKKFSVTARAEGR